MDHPCLYYAFLNEMEIRIIKPTFFCGANELHISAHMLLH